MSTAGPPQGGKAPLGGSDAHVVGKRGGAVSAPRTRVQRRPVHGVLLLDKPLGLSSNNALQKAKWLLRAEKAGHTGTLDPLATGVLPICFGAATKFSQLTWTPTRPTRPRCGWVFAPARPMPRAR